MNLKKVYIYSNMTAQRAQDKINSMLADCEESKCGLSINFDLKIETTVTVGKHTETRYTLVIYVYEMPMYEEFYEHGELEGE